MTAALRMHPDRSTERPTPGSAVTRCRVCARSTTRAAPVCFCCRLVAEQLGLPLVPLVALVEYRVGDRTHHRLRGYKDDPVHEVRAQCRRHLVDELSRSMAVRRRHLDRQLGTWSCLLYTSPSPRDS